jgi:hypothetical protein
MLVVCVFASALGGLIMCLLVLRDVFWPATADAPRTELDLQVTKVGHVVAAACFAMTAVFAIILVARTPLRAAQPVAQPHVSLPDPRIGERLAALERDRTRLPEQMTALSATMQTLREQVTATDGGVQALRARLDQAENRMAKAESGLTSADAGLKRLSDEVAQTNARARQAERTAATKPAPVAPREMIVPAAPPVPPPPPPQRRTEVERPHESASPPTTAAAASAPTTQVAPAPTAHVAPPPTAPQPPVASTPPKPAAPSAKAATAKPAPSAAASAPQDAPPANVTDKVRNDWSVIRRGFSTLGDDFSNAMRDFGRRATGRD